MRVSLKKAFTILDGRLSTKMDDVYEMLNFIFSENLYTHQIPTAMRKLKELNPHSSVGQLEDITYLVITQSLRRIDGGEQEFTGRYERCHPETAK